MGLQACAESPASNTRPERNRVAIREWVWKSCGSSELATVVPGASISRQRAIWVLMRGNGRIGTEVRPPDIPADRNRDKQRIEHSRGQVRLVRPVGEAQVGHAPLLIVIVSGKLDSNGVADLAVKSVGADEPAPLHSAFDAILADSNPDCLVIGLQIDKFDPSI